MKIFAATYTDVIKFDRKPNEDFYLISKRHPIFVVADGVTNSRFPTGEYSFPSGAQAAAEIFCTSALEYLEKNFKPSLKTMEEALDFANKRIRELNENEGMTKKLDYYIYDYFDCVAITGFIFENRLFYGYVGDCGLAIFNENNKLRFQTKDEVIEASLYLKKISKEKGFSQKRKEIFWRKEMRNHPSGKRYGTFTGEENVKKYYRFGQILLQKEDLIIFYSDGIKQYLNLPRFVKILRTKNKKALDKYTVRKAKENYKKFGTDRTFIAIRVW